MSLSMTEHGIHGKMLIKFYVNIKAEATIMNFDDMQLKYDEIKKQAIPDLILSRPDGYYGNRINIQLTLVNGYIIEISPTGCYRCPAVSRAIDHNEVLWLVKNHPNFKGYKVIK